MPLVSVIIPSYNHERYVAESIESVLRQDFDDFELIIIDDASTDASRQIVQRYERDDSRIRAIFHEANCGIAKTVNDGIEAARGKFIAFSASDDVWMESKLSKQLKAMERDENLVVWSEGELIDDAGRPLGKSFSDKQRSASRKKSGAIFQELLKGNYVFGTTLLFKRENLGAIRFDERLLYLNDHKFALDLARKRDFYYIAEPLARYRIHGRNTVVGTDAGVRERQRIVGREYFSICKQALRDGDNEIERKTKAVMYGKMGAVCYSLGQKKRALHLLLQAVRCNPFETSNFSRPREVFRYTLSNMQHSHK
jgi:glycosyltransferase involved in cell wall biosynthesis